jgi:hypothetical protein
VHHQQKQVLVTAAVLVHEPRVDQEARVRAALDGRRGHCLRAGHLTQGAIVGWTPDDDELLRCCGDIALCVAVLSRRIGDLYLARRDADLSWRAVFGAPFAIDDERACAWRSDR